ncbi:MAG: PTS sugar transporter subunit IIA [Spirochaetaceae bacterium]|jgi:mannitol/fructose-specific phosphotransferase system IIA component (Ntr-type)|nr:PTS sugar transporter subunit IIA [Spirochaetaceae bacterium]
MKMLLSDIFDERLITLDLKGADKNAVFEELIAQISSVKPELSKEEMLNAIISREAKMPTSIAHGVAIPHGYFHGFSGIIGAMGFSRKGIDYEANDNKPVHLVFMLLLGDDAREQHLHVLSRILSFVKYGALSYIGEAENPKKAYAMLCKAGGSK